MPNSLDILLAWVDADSISNVKDATHLQFRLIFVERKGIELKEEVTFISRTHALSMVNE